MHVRLVLLHLNHAQCAEIQVLWNLGATCFSIGNEQGVPQAIIDRCLGRMKIWVELATATVLAEFPDFEFCQAVLKIL